MGDYPEPYGASLRPYQPSLRDRLAAMLMGESKSAERHNFVEGLMGSTGLGSTGPGLIDFVPGGQVLPFEEMAQGGRYKALPDYRKLLQELEP